MLFQASPSGFIRNDAETFRDYTMHLRKWLDGDMEGPLFDDQFDGMIRIHGSGGSPEIKGSFAPSPLTDSKDGPQLVLPLHQSLDNHINEALHRMAAEGSVVAVYVNEDIFHHDNDGHTDGNNACVKSKQATSPTNRQKLGHRIKEPTSGEKYCSFLGHFGCTSYGLKRERETTLSLWCAGETQQRQMYSRYRLIPHVEVGYTPCSIMMIFGM